MTIIVETGTGSASSESYASVAFCDAYHSDRGNASWAGLTTSAKEQALRKATDDMMQKFRGKWQGIRSTLTQALDWPRLHVIVDEIRLIENNIVPTEVQAACAMLALVASTEDLNPAIGRVKDAVTVGPLSVTYSKSSAINTRYVAVEMLLEPLLIPGSGGAASRAVRA